MLIFLILVYGIYIGYRRGLVMQAVYTIGYCISFGIAVLSYRVLAPQLDLIVPYPSTSPHSYFAFFSSSNGVSFLDTAFYRGVALLLIILVGWIVTRLIAAYLHDLTFFPLDLRTSQIGGGFLAFLCNYVAIFMVLYVLALVPLTGLQRTLNNSLMASSMIRYSLGLPQLFYHLLIATS